MDFSAVCFWWPDDDADDDADEKLGLVLNKMGTHACTNSSSMEILAFKHLAPEDAMVRICQLLSAILTWLGSVLDL